MSQVKSNELRIGNWIEIDQYGNTRNIIQIHSGSEIDQVIKLRPSPIPITHEILEQVGETKLVIGDSRVYWKIGDFLYGEGDFHLSKGLHWLQNYHFFRTGEELIFRPQIK